MFIPISTTNTIAGAEIVQHKGLVSSRTVLGTGLFSDWAAGLSDIFGGRSNTYENQLERLYSILIDNLKLKAKRQDANGIIGLKIDIDEISGKGMQMFMISGIGTAVKIKFHDPHTRSSSSISGATIRNRIIERECNEGIQRIIEHIKNDSSIIDEEKIVKMFKLAIKNSFHLNLHGIFTIVLNKSRIFISEDLIDSIGQYIQTLDAFTVNSAFYETCFTLCQSNQKSFYLLLTSRISSFIKDNLSVDYKSISNYIDKFPVYMWRGMFYILLAEYKEQYKADDVLYIDKICNKLKEPPKEKFPITEQKRGKRKWDCICGQSNSIDKELCSCSLDIYGWSKKTEEKTTEILNRLMDIKQILEENLA